MLSQPHRLELKHLVLPFFLMAATLYGDILNEAYGLYLSQGRLSVARGDAVILLEDHFTSESPAWVRPFKTLENFTRISLAPTYGAPSLKIERNPNQAPIPKRLFDTAWELTSRTFKLPPKAKKYILEFEVFSNSKQIAAAAGHKDMYHNRIQWLDEEKKRLPVKTHFSYSANDRNPALTITDGEVPKDAVYAILQLGADTPDLLQGEYIAFKTVKFAIIPEDGRYLKYGGFVTVPQQVSTGAVKANGDIPPGCSLQWQIATAPDVNSIPGQWSAFAGPDATASSWFKLNASLPVFTESQKWMRFKVRLNATDYSTPTVTRLIFGKSSEMNWNGYKDDAPPEYERISKSPAADAEAPFVFKLKDANPTKWDSFKLTLNGKDVTSKATRNGATITLKPDNAFPQGVNVCKIEAQDSLGNTLSDPHVFFIGKMRETNIVTLRDDGMTLIDGKPFFPLGMACAVKCEHNNNDFNKLFQMFQEAGLNFARHFSGLNASSTIVNEYLETAGKHGVKIYMAAGRNANDLDIAQLAINTAKQLNMSNIALDMGDDTANHITPEQMRLRYETVKAVDPFKPTTQADPLGQPSQTRYKPYARYTDNFSPEIYPTHNNTKADLDATVPTVIMTMKAIKSDLESLGSPLRSCWPLIQYFYNTGSWQRLSDRTELRAMSYQAVIHGAHGVIWYRYAGYGENTKKGFTPEQWEVVASVSREMRQLYDVLCARAYSKNPQPTVTAGPVEDVLHNPSVSSLLKEHDGKLYLFAASSVRENTTASFTIPEAKSVTDFFDKRIIPVQNGAFNENFTPLGVHVYVIERR